MRAGTLRHLVSVQRPVNVRDAVGDVQLVWTVVATDWAAIEPLSPRDQILAAQANSTITHKIRLRYQPAYSEMDGSWRVQFGPRFFDIDGYPRNVDERNILLEILCTEGLRYVGDASPVPSPQPVPGGAITQLGLMGISVST